MSTQRIGFIGTGVMGSGMIRNLQKAGYPVIKDMRIALESAEEKGLDLPGLRLAKKLYDQLADQGMENCGTQALFQWYDHQ